MSTVRSFILLGQYGIGKGMLALKEPLSRFGDVSVHEWYDQGPMYTINRTSDKVAVIGFSLGANQLGWIGSHVNRLIDLGVGYDPSRKSPLARWNGAEYVQLCARYKRLICYYNPSTWYFGGAKYDAGETARINQSHFSVPNNQTLHDITIQAVIELAEGK